jgi:xanthine dehydrogenase accessory factor
MWVGIVFYSCANGNHIVLPGSRNQGMTDSLFGDIAVFLQKLASQPAVLVEVQQTEGSAPREAGTWMAVFADSLVATIGGGHLEFVAIARARALLERVARASSTAETAENLRLALGPSLGQCCGGVVHLQLRLVSAANLPALQQQLEKAALARLVPVALFGGGHVGHALARILARLPFFLTWIDSRDGVFPAAQSPQVHCEHSEPVQAAVAGLAPHSRVLIMSFSHAEDLDILAACLQRQRAQADLPYIGLIGSKTKWATFRHRLAARGFIEAELAHVTSPIGVAGITGKEPAVIAVAVAAQLLQTLG